MPQKNKNTPMMKQYFKIKKKYINYFLFYRLGDFYELFFDDAIKASKILNLTLTFRNKNADDKIPMCGVPYISVLNYISILIKNGYKIAICEQISNIKKSNGLFEREVVRLVTPGTIIDDLMLNSKSNNYLSFACILKNKIGFSYVDISTGDLKSTILNNINEIIEELISLNCKEIVLDHIIFLKLSYKLKKINIVVTEIINNKFKKNFYIEKLLYNFKENNVQKKVVKFLLNYLFFIQKYNLFHIKKVIFYKKKDFLQIDYNSKINLEIIESIKNNGNKNNTLLNILDKTKTSMGARLLKQWLNFPLINIKKIKFRYKKIKCLLKFHIEVLEIRKLLINIYDLERIISHISFENINCNDFIKIKKSLLNIIYIKNIILKINNNNEWNKLLKKVDNIKKIYDLINFTINDNYFYDKFIFKTNYDKNLDKYKNIINKNIKKIKILENNEQKLTKIKNLKIKFNNIFGYYIEVTKTNLLKLKKIKKYKRKQTLVNSERFIIPELKDIEIIILENKNKLTILEKELFKKFCNFFKSKIYILQEISSFISLIDVLQSFTLISENYKYIEPILKKSNKRLYVINSRHPVVEHFIEKFNYIPNNIEICNNKFIKLITGPNMSGKSTYMRQVALIIIMAQIGCFVPADYAEIPIFDKIFTRIGASDNLSFGKSTFMLEMLESNFALKNATKNSLILFDELGRGTSTNEGISLAQAIIEYIDYKIKAKTLFSTHYYELVKLEKKIFSIENIYIDVLKENEKIKFSHKIFKGYFNKSFGIYIAKMAKLPFFVINRANIILKKINNIDNNKYYIKYIYDKKNIEIINKLKKLDLCKNSPLYIVNFINLLKKKIND